MGVSLLKLLKNRKIGRSVLGCIVVLLLFFVSPCVVYSSVSIAQIDAAMSKELESYPEELFGLDWFDSGVQCQDQWLATVYHNLGVHPLWVNEEGPTDQAERIFAALKNANVDGLDPSDYGVYKIASEWEGRSEGQLVRLDIDLTLGLLAFIYDMREGRMAPRLHNPKLFDQAGCVVFDPVNSIAEVLKRSDPSDYFASLAPQHRHYRVLRQQLHKYLGIAAHGGWPRIALGETLRSSDVDSRIPAVRALLTITGDLSHIEDSQQDLFSKELELAVKSFQDRHGLEVDGVIGKKTIAAFNVSAEERVTQILINMERWRWTEHNLGSKYVLVDIAGFELQGVVDDVVQLDMRVIVGKQHHETPVFSDSIKYIDFNPFWNITPSIARNEMLEKLREDSEYLESKHIRLFSSWQADGVEIAPQSIDWSQVSKKQIGRYKLRQDPGEWNALGVVKFVFPNKYSIYMHDTPGRNLFEKSDRAFSHGCIRLGAPNRLAEFLLAGNEKGWTLEKISRLIETNKRKIISLKPPVPVHLVYQTAWVDKDEVIHFSKDLYGRDQQLIHALFGEEKND